MSDLGIQRAALQSGILDHDNATDIIQRNWAAAEQLIKSWWGVYEAWEARDTFNKAVADRRMTMRTFGEGFNYQLKKTVPMNIAENSRFYANSNRGKLLGDEQASDYQAFQNAVSQPNAYANPQRGIDTSAFANPANFQSRKLKYEHGLHDLSVKVLIPGEDIKGQSHHSGSANPHFCFLPLSKPQDQYVIFKLIQYASVLRNTVPQLYDLTRDIRSKMTRVKLAHGYDMGTGYIAIRSPGQQDNLPFKVSYSIGNNTKVRKEEMGPDRKAFVPVSMDMIRDRQRAYFEHEANVVRRSGNEFVIAMRRHNGPFPVYARFDGGMFKCYDLKDNQAKIEDDSKIVTNGRTISAVGVASW
jgi:hypothetical protein